VTNSQKRLAWKLAVAGAVGLAAIVLEGSPVTGTVLFVSFVLGYLIGFEDSNQADYDDDL
jgi:hypothetical protein